MSDLPGFISTQKLFVLFSPLSHGDRGNESGWVGVWPLAMANPAQN